jgi:hypothetical protein
MKFSFYIKVNTARSMWPHIFNQIYTRYQIGYFESHKINYKRVVNYEREIGSNLFLNDFGG